MRALEQALVDGHDVVFIHKGQFFVDLGELRLAVGAQVLVAVAAGDLEIAVEAGKHQQLLVQLRALRQRVEMAGLHAAGDQVIARAFGRRFDQGRGLDLAEMVFAEIAAHDLADLRALDDGLVHGRAAQVEIAVAQAQVVAHLDVVAHLERRGLRLAQNAQLGHIQLDIAGGDLIGLGGALAQDAARNDDILALQAFGFGKDIPGGVLVKHQLQNAGGVPQVGKDDAALVTRAGDRTADGHLAPGVGQAQLAAVIGAAQAAHRFHTLMPLFMRRQAAKII